MKRHIAIVGLLAWLLIACNPVSPTAPAPSPTGAPVLTPQPAPLTPTVKPIPSPTPAAPLPPLPPLPTLVPHPTVASTPFPDEQAIVDAVLGTGTSEHNAANLVSGSFTAPGADEHLALVSGIGDYDELRWVVIGQTGDGWRLRGVSEVLGTGFSAPPDYYVPPDLLDFDGDSRQEVLSPYFKMQWGWISSSDTLYRWDGHTLARIWETTIDLDNRMADNRDVPQQYRQNYRATWEWVDLDGDAPDEILLHEETAFYLPGEEGYVKDDAPSTGEESGERAFRWDGEAFRPYAPNGPAGDFAYIAGDTLWLWQNRTAHPLGMKGVREFLWSPDGQRIAWWAETSIEGTFHTILGVYDLPAGDRWEFPLDGAPSTLRWAPDGRLAYAVLPNYPHALLDPETGQQEPLPIGFSDTWSPEGDRVAYERSGGVYVYAPTTGQERLLVRSPEGAGRATPRPFGPVWSPRGDWIACSLETITDTWVGLVYPGAPEPVGASDLLDTFSGRESPALQFAWSPDGSRLAVLTSDPRPSTNSGHGSAQQPTTLYLADVPAGGDDPVGLPEWREALQLETVTQTVRLAWSPDGERVAAAVGNDVWQVPARRGAVAAPTLRHRFSFPDPQWETLEWAPDGSGFLAGLTEVYDEHLYWFPAGDAEPVLLLIGSAAAHWAPRTVEAQASPEARPPMVLVEYTDDVPLLHFVDEDGTDVSVPAEGYGGLGFQVAGERVYYGGYYADRSGVVSLDVPDVLDVCRPPLVSPDGSQLAWLCDDVDDNALMSGLTPEFHFALVLTDAEGNHPRQVWSNVESGPGYRLPHLVSWRADGQVIYLTQREYMVGWAYFDYNPAMLALDVRTGEAVQIGADDAFDAAVSPAGDWLAQSYDEGAIVLRSLAKGTEQTFSGGEKAFVAGNFSFSPEGRWLAWLEYTGLVYRLRAVSLPNGEPMTVLEMEEAELTDEPRLAGWMGLNEVVLVWHEYEGPRGSSYHILLPDGKPEKFSPYDFLGVLGKAPSIETSDTKSLGSRRFRPVAVRSISLHNRAVSRWLAAL